MTFWKRIICSIFVCALLLGCVGCAGAPDVSAPSPSPTAAPTPTATPEPTPDPATLPQPDFYTLRLAADSVPLCWNPHRWESEADGLLRSCTVSPLFDLRMEDRENGRQAAFVPEMALGIEDVTGEFADSAQFGILPEETGRVWRIRLNPDACWNDEARTPITAADYLYSMQALLDPAMQNYRAEAFLSGPAALAGAAGYYNSGRESMVENVSGEEAVYPCADWVFDRAGGCTAPDGTALYFALSQPLSWLQGHSLRDYYQAGYVPEEIYASLLKLADGDGYLPVTAESADLLYSFTGSEAWGRESRERLACYTVFPKSWPEAGWDSVSFIKEDELTLLYVCAAPTSEFDLCYALTVPFLVYQPLYEAGKFTYDGLVYTDYGTSPETSMSCGPYFLVGVEGTVFTLERNPAWYGYADGRHEGEYQTDRIQLQAQSRARAQERFLAGELELLDTETAEAGSRLLKPDGYVSRFFLATDAEALQRLQEAAGESINKTCLANAAFREALSLSIDRSAFAAEEACSLPALGLIGSGYYDSLAADALSRYRGSEAGARALCSVYGGTIAGETSAQEAAARLTGQDLDRAKRLFALAFDQMVEDGSWQEGMTIELRCAVGSGELTETQLRQNAILQEGLAAASAGTGFEGKLTVTFCSYPDRYDAVAAGEIEMGYGAWGGALFDPYTLLRCYCDPEFTPVQEGCGFDPTAQLLTLLLDGEPVTMTYCEWCRSLLDGGEYASDPTLRRMLLGKVEESLLMLHCCIPVTESCSAVCISARLIPGSTVYDPLCGWGGLRTLRYAFDDAQWAAEIAAQP